MDFLDPNKKRSHKIRLYLGYILSTIAIGLGAIVLLYATYGFGVDKKGNVFQNGLVFVASVPDAAEVNITNDSGFNKQVITSERLVLPADTYKFEFLKQGYRPWTRTINLRGAYVERLVYALLFPEELVTSEVATYSAQTDFASATPDRKKLVIRRPGQPNFDVYDTTKEDLPKTSFSLPSDLVSGEKLGKVQLVEWSSDGKQFLIKHTSGSVSEFLVIDIERPELSVNVNKLIGEQPKTVRLFDKKADQAHVHFADNSLQRVNLETGAKTLVVRRVYSFVPHGQDNILYVADHESAGTGNVGVIMRENDETFFIRGLPKKSDYLLDLARHDDTWVVAAGNKSSDRIYVYRNPVSIIKSGGDQTPLLLRNLRIDQPSQIGFSANTQFLMAQNKQNFVVYDIKDDNQYRFKLETTLDKGAELATWMDGHRLISSYKNKVLVFDFDGSNQNKLSPTLPSIAPMFDDKYENMYTISTSSSKKGQFSIIKTKLRIEE